MTPRLFASLRRGRRDREIPLSTSNAHSQPPNQVTQAGSAENMSSDRQSTYGPDFHDRPLAREKAGMREWFTRQDDEHGVIDLVVVHGLQGDWERTWEQDGKIWLRDFLPKKIPNMRVLSFGYDSQLAFADRKQELEDFSVQLLVRLKSYRSEDEQKLRPIIFLGHSLGGILVKKALIIAHAHRRQYSNILDSTNGLIFMGVPHRGTDDAFWGAFLKRLMTFLAAKTGILDDLKCDSRTLTQISADFSERASHIPHIISYYELKSNPLQKRPVVEKFSATLDLPHEQRIPLDEDHSSMCKFNTDQSQRFDAVYLPIYDMVRKIRQTHRENRTQRLEDLLGILPEPMGADINDSIIEPAEGTCRWILEHKEFEAWAESKNSSSILWITGSPGSGKSVLADFISKHVSKISSVCRFAFEKKQTAEDFLYAMMRQSLKVSLSGTGTELLNHAFKKIRTMQPGWTSAWEQLCRFWISVCVECMSGKLTWIIDGLDECANPEKRKQVLYFLSKISSALDNEKEKSFQMRFLLTSRPEVWEERDRKASCNIRRILLGDELAVSNDVKRLIDQEVGSLTEDNRLNMELAQWVKQTLYGQADQTFLVVALRLKLIVNNTYLNKNIISQSLTRHFDNLDSLYDELLAQVKRESPLPLAEITCLLQILLASNGQVTTYDVCVLLALDDTVGEKRPRTVQAVLEKANSKWNDISYLDGSFFRFLTAPDGTKQVRLVHLTAKEYLYQKKDLIRSPSHCHLQLAKRCVWYLLLGGVDRGIKALSHETKKPSREYHILLYALQNWALHVRESEESIDADFLKDILKLYEPNTVKFRLWTDAQWHSSFSHSMDDYTPLHMCVLNGHVRPMNSILGRFRGDDAEHNPILNETDSRGDTPLHWAARFARPSVTGALLHAGANISMWNDEGLTPLHIAVVANQLKVVRMLANKKGVNIDVRTRGKESRRTALHIAAAAGFEDIIDELIEFGADMESTDGKNQTAADIAFKMGHGTIYEKLLTQQNTMATTDLDRAIMESDAETVRTLVLGGESPVRIDSRGSTPIHRACRGNAEMLHILLQAVSNLEFRDMDGMNPLHLSCRYGKVQAVEILLGKGCLVNSQSEYMDTPLHMAATVGNDEIVSLLLRHGASISPRNSEGQTPLFIAASLGFRDVVEKILAEEDPSADILVVDYKGRNPLHEAAEKGHSEIVKAIITRDPAKIDTEDHAGSTALLLAATGTSLRHTRTVQLLIANGADILHEQKDDSNAIHQAARNGNEESMKALLAENNVTRKEVQGCLDRTDSSRSTPLFLASARNHENTALLLLRHGAKNVSLRGDSSGGEQGRRDLLCWAAYHGSLNLVRELLQMPGIAIDSVDDEQRTPLSWSAANGHTTVVKCLLAHQDATVGAVKVDSLDIRGRTPLSWAAAAGRKEAARLLLHAGAETTLMAAPLTIKSDSYISCDSFRRTPVAFAVAEGHNDVLLEFKEEDCLYSERNCEASLLSFAACYGRKEVLITLLSRKYGNINATNTLGATPLMLASANGHEEIVEILLQQGADIHITHKVDEETAAVLAVKHRQHRVVEALAKHDLKCLDVVTTKKRTLLYWAVCQNDYFLVKFLLARGLNPHYVDPSTNNTLLHEAAVGRDCTVFQLLLGPLGHFLNKGNLVGRTPLWLSASKGRNETVDIILQHIQQQQAPCGKFFTKDILGRSILSAAVSGGSFAITRRMLDLAIDKSQEIGVLDNEERSPLTRAASSNLGQIVRLFLSVDGFNHVDQQDPEKHRSPLLWACHLGEYDTVKQIIDSPKANRYIRGKEGESSILLSAESGYLDIVRLLLRDQHVQQDQQRADWINAGNSVAAHSPLLVSIRKGYGDITELLLGQQAININYCNRNMETALLMAAMNGELATFNKIQSFSQANISVRNVNGQNALAVACMNNHIEIVDQILKNSEQHRDIVNAQDNHGYTALAHAAEQSGDPKVVSLLLHSNASPDIRVGSMQSTPLMLAAARGHLQIVKLLVENSPSGIDATNIQGQTALTMAVVQNQGNVVRYLLMRRANPNVMATRSNRTPAMEAAYFGCDAAMRELLLSDEADWTKVNTASRGVTWFLVNGITTQQREMLLITGKDPNIVAQYLQEQLLRLTSTRNFETFLEFHEDRLNVNERGLEGETPLLMVCGQHKPLVLRRLLELGADINFQSFKSGRSAFHEAAKYGDHRSMYELLSFDPVGAKIEAKDVAGNTVLAYATGCHPGSDIQEDEYRVVKMLLGYHAKIDTKNLVQKTPLMHAANRGWARIVGLLLSYGADLAIVDKNHRDALYFATLSGSFITVKRILEADDRDAGANFNIPDSIGMTPTLVAAQHGFLHLVQLFAQKRRLDLEVKNRQGRTALSLAAESGHEDIVSYLLEQHKSLCVSINDVDRQDQTPFLWACKGGHYNIARLLIHHGANWRKTDRNNRSPLSHAAEKGHWQIILLLLEQAANSYSTMINQEDSSGRTAISLAAEHNEISSVRILLDHGADQFIHDKKWQTARRYAVDAGHGRIIALLDEVTD